MASVTDNECLSVDPISGPSDPLAAWHSCEGVCSAQLEHLVDTCGRQGQMPCFECVGDNHAALAFAKCTQADFQGFCGNTTCVSKLASFSLISVSF